MLIYGYSEQLQSFIDNLQIKIKYKNITIDIMYYLPYLKKGYIHKGAEINTLFKLSSYFNNNLEFNIGKTKFVGRVNCDDISSLIKISRESDILNSLLGIFEFKVRIVNMCEIIKICIYNSVHNDLLNIITTNNNMKSIYNIIKGNIGIATVILSKNKGCPFIGYSISRLKDNETNNYIKSICIKRIWYIKQILLYNTNDDIISVILDYINEFLKEE